MKKLFNNVKMTKTTKKFNLVCLGIMAMSVIMFAVGSLLK